MKPEWQDLVNYKLILDVDNEQLKTKEELELEQRDGISSEDQAYRAAQLEKLRQDKKQRRENQIRNQIKESEIKKKSIADKIETYPYFAHFSDYIPD